VVHGLPALACAVTPEARATWSPHEQSSFELDWSGQALSRIDLDSLPKRLEEIQQRYQAFLKQELDIREVLRDDQELLIAATALAGPGSGGRLSLECALPTGSGLGSSAAVILALLKSLRPELSPVELFERALQAEHFQHGHSSGLDVAVSQQGGALLRMDGKDLIQAELPFPSTLQLFHSGRPAESTGECVAAVAHQAPATHPIWEEFRPLPEAMLRCFLKKDQRGLRDVFRENHRLLTRIGVCPPALQEIIRDIEACGAAAKLCGAGALTGNQGGVVLVLGEELPPLPTHWQPLPLEPSPFGTRVLD